VEAVARRRVADRRPPTNVGQAAFRRWRQRYSLRAAGPGRKALTAALADLKPGISSLLATAQDSMGAELAGGSNNWAISAERTSTGRPIVAGDPHRVLEMPNMYAQATSPATRSTSSA